MAHYTGVIACGWLGGWGSIKDLVEDCAAIAEVTVITRITYTPFERIVHFLATGEAKNLQKFKLMVTSIDAI